MKKILVFIAIFLTCITQADAKAAKFNLTSIIEKSDLNNSAIVAVSIRDAKSGKIEYQYNQEKLLHPASVLKLITLPVALNTLTPQYKYKTEFAIDKNNNLFIKLSADPLLNSTQLKLAIKELPTKEIKNIYIDDKILDRYEWGIGWMWDDETNPRMAKISPYNLNQNILKAKITPTVPNQQPQIHSITLGSTNLMNMLKTNTKDELIVFRQNAISPNTIFLYGTIATPQVVEIPVSNPERFFISNLTALLKQRNVSPAPISVRTYPNNQQNFYTITNGIDDLIPQILQESNNFFAETLFKTASAVQTNSQGSFKNEKNIFDTYYSKLGLNTDKIVLADGSGVSRNNLFSTNWISEAMFKIQKDENFNLIKSNMAYPTNGTLKKRLNDYKDNLKAKTGTLANNSTIAGYLTDQKGKEHIFVIFVANFNDEVKTAQELQDELIKAIYNN